MLQLLMKNWPQPNPPEERERKAKEAERRLAELRRRAIALGVAVDSIDRKSE